MNISAVLLAGGESRRMGRDKATMEWRGQSLWSWQIEKLRALRPAKIFLSARTDPLWRPADIELVVDAAPSRGPLSGLSGALATMETKHLLVLAVDMPFMTTAHLRHLCGLATAGVGAIPMIAGKAEPLCAIYPMKTGVIFLEALRKDDFSLQPIVKELIAAGVLQAVAISDSDRKLYQSFNEPSDLLAS